LGGSSVATASFVRRSINGRIRRRSAASRSASRPTSIGLAQLSLNSAGRGCSPGATIDRSDHRSINEFSSGVPVIANLARAVSRRTAW
jgi:hypothetical protein